MSNDSHHERVHDGKHRMNVCIGCGCSIPAYGGKKRCASCDHENRLETQRVADRARRLRKALAKQKAASD